MILIKADKWDVNRELRFASMAINHLNDGIFITDHNNRIIFLNRSIEKLTGYRKEELLGKNPRILKSGLHDRRFYQKMWRSLLDDGSWEGEVLNRKKDGQLYYERLKIIVIKNKKGDIVNFLAILSDITKEKLLEKDIQLASQIQFEMLRKDIKNDYFQTKSFFLPKRYVSGDFYDYIWLEDKKILFGVVIDFKGHGFSSALLTSAIQVIFHKVMTNYGADLAEKVNLINKLSYKYFTNATFAAALFFEIDFIKQVLTYVSAGINCFLLLSKEKKALIEVPGIFLGMFEEEKFDQNTMQIHPGDVLYFMSDGISDGIPKNTKWERLDFQTAYETLAQIGREQWEKDDVTFLGIEILKGGKVAKFNYRFEIRDIDNFYSLKDEIENALKQLNVSDIELLWIALTEGINNAWLHGNKKNKDKKILLTIKSIRNKRIIFRIKDQGNGYSGNEQVKKFIGNVDQEFDKRMFDESGRGLLIMMKVFDKVIYNQQGNELFLVKNIKK